MPHFILIHASLWKPNKLDDKSERVTPYFKEYFLNTDHIQSVSWGNVAETVEIRLAGGGTLTAKGTPELILKLMTPKPKNPPSDGTIE